MVYGLSIANRLGLLEGWTAYYFGNMEEWCDGIAPNSFVEVDPGVRPDFVVIGEPTKMQVYRGRQGPAGDARGSKRPQRSRSQQSPGR